ncbi:hypothetical protein EYF80_035572 [Liparis tanakae]|uniref:Uncharacterized protein n=1 Tax=Liparis tanakae TaxID=230148 RepID=A0A4Z2GLV6_9TELE|nr:hypothetical protein EYF80_035572 [Liparis tanakae]
MSLTCEGSEEKQRPLKSSNRVHSGTWEPTQSSRARGECTRYRRPGSRLAAQQRSAAAGSGEPERRGTDQRQQQGVEVAAGAGGVHAEQLAALLQPPVDRAAEARQQNFTLPQTVDVDGERTQKASSVWAWYCRNVSCRRGEHRRVRVWTRVLLSPVQVL